MAGPSVGYAALQIIPSAKGFGSALSGEISKPLGDAGEEAGGKFSSGMGKTLLKGGLAALGAAAAAALAKGFGDALAAEANEGRIAASLGVSPERAAELGDVAAGVYRDAWGESLESVTDAVTGLESSFEGLGGDQLGSLTEQAIALGDAFGIDVGSGIQTASELVSSGLAGSAEEAFDLLTAGLQEMPQGIRDELLEASNEYGDFFADLGLSGEEAFGLLVEYAEDGVYGIDKFGDSLKELTIRGTDMSKASVEAYDAAGLSAEEMAAKLLAGGEDALEATQDIASGLLDIEDPAERANAAIALFGTPLEDLGTAEIPAFLQSLTTLDAGLGDTTGAAQAMADTLSDNTSAKIEAFKRQALGGIADFIADYVIPGVESMAAWFEENWPRIREAVEPVMIAVQDLITTVTEAIRVIWERWGDTIRDLVENRFETIRTVVESVLGVIQGIIQTITALIKGDWDGVWEGIKQTVMSVWEGIKGIVLGALTELKILALAALGALRDGVAAVWEGIKTLIANAIGGARDAVGTAIDGIVGFVTALPGRILGAIGDTLSLLAEKGLQIITGLKDGVETGWESLKSWLGAMPTRLLNALGDMGQVLYDAGKAVLTGFIDGIKSMATGVKDALGGITSKLTSWKGPASLDKVILVESGHFVMEGFLRGLMESESAIESYLTGLTGRVGTDFVVDMRANSAVQSAQMGAAASRTLTFGDVHVTERADVEAMFQRANAALAVL